MNVDFWIGVTAIVQTTNIAIVGLIATTLVKHITDRNVHK